MDKTFLQQTRARYQKELTDNVIPFWEKHCIDKEYGGYFTSLDRDGSVYDTNKYMWMQWRIVYVFTELFLSEYSNPHYLDIARKGFDFLLEKGKDPSGQYYFAINRQGVPHTAAYNVFSECFAAMGAGMLYKATKESRYADEAQSAMNNYIARIKSGNPAGAWNKAMPGREEYLSLGHYMMLANLGLIMDDCLGGNRYSKELDLAVDVVLNKFWQPDLGVVMENIRPDGSVDLESCQGRMLNPGHVLEAMWFLLNALEKRENDPAVKKQICDIIARTIDLGWDKEYGGIYYFMDVLGKPHLELQHNMKLWWPHNEALIAALFAYKHTGEERFARYFEMIDQWTWSHFPDPEYGEWYAYLDRQGTPTHSLKGGKWKTFFHLPRCLMVCADQLGQLEKMV